MKNALIKNSNYLTRGAWLPSFIFLIFIFVAAIYFASCAVSFKDWNDPDKLEDSGVNTDDDDDNNDSDDDDNDDNDAKCKVNEFSPPLLSPEKSLESLVHIEGVLTMGEVMAKTLNAPTGAWLANLKKGNYVFTVESRMKGDEFYQLAFYGPRGEQGRFGEASWVYNNYDCKKNIKMETEVTKDGIYLLFLREVTGAENTDYFIGYHCKETGLCEDPCCHLDPCALICQNGFAYDDEGCVLCACEYICFSDNDCPEDFYCVDGKCRNNAPSCQDDYDPVCGDNGKTYANECEAEKSGVEVEHEGVCETQCLSNADCMNGEICENGFCVTSTTIDDDDDSDCECPHEYDPVCGVDNITYGNECTAKCQGVEISYNGECKDIKCGGESNIPCPSGMECKQNAAGKEGVCVNASNP